MVNNLSLSILGAVDIVFQPLLPLASALHVIEKFDIPLA